MSSPLLIHYQHGGIHYMLCWWADGDRGHVILTRSMEALTLASHRVFKDNPDAEIREAAKIEVVAPSDEMEEAARKYQREQQIDRFFDCAVWRVKSAVEDHGMDLPHCFGPCTKYTHSDPEYLEDEGFTERHTSCQRCCEKIMLRSMSKEEFFDKYAADWSAIFDKAYKDYPVNNRYRDSLARKIKKNESISAIFPNFGHHSGGAEVWDEVDHQSTPVLFYYKRISGLNRAPFEATLAAYKWEWDEARKLKDRTWKDQVDKERHAEAAACIRFFEERK